MKVLTLWWLMRKEEELWGERCWARKGKGKWKAATWDTSSSRLHPPDDLDPQRTHREEATDCGGKKPAWIWSRTKPPELHLQFGCSFGKRSPVQLFHPESLCQVNCMMPPHCQPDGYRVSLPLPAFLALGRLSGQSYSGQQVREGPRLKQGALACSSSLVEASPQTLSDLSPLPVLEGLDLSQLQKRAGGYLAIDE